MDKIGRYEFLAEPFHCDYSGRLFMGHLGNHMLNAADFHSTARGFGMKYLYFTNRNFKVVGDDGRVKAWGRSVWAMIDTETRHPEDIFAIDNGAINNWIVKEYDCPIDKCGRVAVSDGVQLIKKIDTTYSDVDINGHINSVKYIEHVLDLWSIDWYKQHKLKRFEIAYVAEAHQGDKLSFYREQLGELEYYVRIVRSDGTETCRSKVVFEEIEIEN